MILALLLACSRPPPPAEAPPPSGQPTVLMISWDTTRADALSSYADVRSWRPDRPDLGPSTPTADALAASGTRFLWALAHAPTTLSSHSSVMSGRDSHGHRVVRNGFPLPPDLPLLAERFAAAGWDTIAVVGASALDADMGLNRGFRVYDDAVGTKVRARYEDRADRVNQRVFAALEGRPDRPLFLFVHYYDPHSPWDSASPEVRQRYPGAGPDEPGPLVKKTLEGRLTDTESDNARAAYLAEVAWTDQQTGVMLDGLRSRGLLDDALIVLFSDHGESLDDPGTLPYGHGPDADLTALHVPLIIAGSGSLATPVGVDDRPARLLDLGSTVLARVGLPGGMGEGQDLFTRTEALPGFAEATKPDARERTDAWNNLPFDRSVVAEGHLLRVTPLRGQSRLSRLAPGQPAVEDEERTARLRASLDAWDAAAPGFRSVEMEEETENALRALGYLE